ncbi:MAG: hypothetical protein LBQ75_01525 [Zoogloeaceae bacterium]|jgi:hypothetical protein|nr:hypothetical protein [Zoogloeaceae bacterium]
MQAYDNMNKKTLLFMRFLIAVQIAVALWFELTPDTLPGELKRAQTMLDTELYALRNSINVPLIYLQYVLCLSLWLPTRFASWAYFAVSASIAGLLLIFRGYSCGTAMDGFFDYLQTLATGAMLGTLWVHGYFSVGRVKSQDNLPPNVQ